MNRIFKISLALLFFSAFFIAPRVQADEKKDYYLRLKESWQDIQRVYEQINRHYVEEVDPYPLIKAGINGMLEKLDPYSVFLEQNGERRLRMITTGKYGGLGMEIGLRDKKITIIAPIDDSPAKRMGIQAGDIIEKVDGKNIIGWNVDQVSIHLRGKIGTKVTLTIRRPGLSEPMELTLTRAEIVLKDVNYAGFLQKGVAYVGLSGFTDKAPKEMRETILKLQQQGSIKAFILDLRGNPGGLLESAVQIVNLFVGKGELVVSTKGFREKEYRFFTTEQALLPDVPLAVLVNGGSASASEIVAGALQDLDRAVIIGEPTFGKGLVQKVYTIDSRRDVKLKLTTAKYYIPSGRCIQKRDYAQNNDVIIHNGNTALQDSVKTFYTRHKRAVKDKGGIYPDIKVKSDSLSYETIQLLHKSMFFNFTVAFHQSHPQWMQNPQVDDSLLMAFQAYLNKKKFRYQSPFAKEFERLHTMALKGRYPLKIVQLLKQVGAEISSEQQNAFEKDKEQIRKFLKLELTEKYAGREGRYRLRLQTDRPALKAIRVLDDTTRYKKILSLK